MSESARPSPNARHYPQTKESTTPLIIILLLILVIMVPIELGFNIGPLFFTWSRFFLFIMAFVILPKLSSLELRTHDWLFIGHVAWTCFAFAYVYGVGGSIERSGTYILEYLIVYLTARIYLQHLDQMRAVFGTLFIMVIISAIAALPEAMTGTRYVHDFATSITGTTYHYRPEIRMGITRATSFFEHPILYGIFCSSLFSLMWFTSSVPQRLIKTPIIAFATWLSASSAPLLILMMQCFLIVVERITRTIAHRLLIVASIGFGLVTFLQIASGRGFAGILASFTLSPGTAYTRRLQWNFAIQDVMRHPLLGFNPDNWSRPFWLHSSIDNWWLLIMMRSGIPSLILLALCALFMWRDLTRRQNMPQLYIQIRTGWGLMMIALILGAATVTFFGKLQPLFAFYLGVGSALVSCRVPEAKDASAPAEAPPGGIRYSRFAHNRKPPTPAARPNPNARSGDK